MSSLASIPLALQTDRAAAILLDWDGCIATHDVPSDGAIAFLRGVADRVVILSNNSTHLPQDISIILAEKGVDIPAERVLLAGAQAILHLRERNRTTMLLASTRIRAFARSVGLPLVRDKPEQVVLMRDTRFTYSKLRQVVTALHEGAHLVVANADRTHPGIGGRPVPETGALLAAIEACLPNIEPEVLGKPGPMLFERACALLDARPEDTVMIGDNPDTDAKGAIALGIRSILIGSNTGLSLRDLARCSA
ncbi:MAG: HAD hydrolase-like protein [Sphingobium sp.]